MPYPPIVILIGTRPGIQGTAQVVKYVSFDHGPESFSIVSDWATLSRGSHESAKKLAEPQARRG